MLTSKEALRLAGCPLALVKFVNGLDLVSFILTSYYIRQERDMDFV